ncbi:MAG: hypothetical protein E7614_01095 [Ruminococcaceae bacterium]|nr:hypothetical protein [Oscillospiraceae bacterium]
MKKNHIILLLALIGIFLLILSLVQTFIVSNGISIIGGVSLPTIKFVFFHYKNGLYFNLASAGFLSIIASIILKVAKKKN